MILDHACPTDFTERLPTIRPNMIIEYEDVSRGKMIWINISHDLLMTTMHVPWNMLLIAAFNWLEPVIPDDPLGVEIMIHDMIYVPMTSLPVPWNMLMTTAFDWIIPVTPDDPMRVEIMKFDMKLSIWWPVLSLGICFRLINSFCELPEWWSHDWWLNNDI